jgi:hypothetical protein
MRHVPTSRSRARDTDGDMQLTSAINAFAEEERSPNVASCLIRRFEKKT